MKENLHAIEENFSALDERMKKVSKWKQSAEFGSIQQGGENGQNVESNEGTRMLWTCGLHSSVALYFASAFFSPSGMFRTLETI